MSDIKAGDRLVIEDLVVQYVDPNGQWASVVWVKGTHPTFVVPLQALTRAK